MQCDATCPGCASPLSLPIQCIAKSPRVQRVYPPACITCAQPCCSTQLACAACSGTKREKYLTENVKAFHVKLTSEDKAALESIFHQDKVIAWVQLGCLAQLLDAVQGNINACLLGVAGPQLSPTSGNQCWMSSCAWTRGQCHVRLALWHCALLCLR